MATGILHVLAPSEVQLNTRPVAVNDSYDATANATLEVDAAAGVLADDTDAEGDSLTASLFGPALHGFVSLNADGSFSYTPEADFSGLDAFLYSISDGSLNSALATVTIHVAPAAIAPADPTEDSPNVAADPAADLLHCLYSPDTDPQAVDEAIRCGFGWLWA